MGALAEFAGDLSPPPYGGFGTLPHPRGDPSDFMLFSPSRMLP